ncbi:outer membrane protein assembly factor BamD [Crocinitomicaceae bacterium]|jgi:outer membrane protein assembly factor BamD|nr:outer membrane protein assembly factor BamD [Crocinitomicaceae bacterium]MDB4682612.1 outer membrane protein assembly factor BamD [Crocinitomicaceae bacterium]MDC0297242.1 outer membrane protein assembly factor BamD [Crocinitomicaceae bacterium]
MRIKFIFGLLFFCVSCSSYNKVVKGDNYAQKFETANALYDDGEFLRSIVLYEQIYQHAPKTGEGELAYYRLGQSYYKSEDYYMAAYYLSSYVQRFPYSSKNEDVMFMAALCNVNNSPQPTLDQSETNEAINSIQMFIDRYPETKYIDSCNQIIDRLRLKLETKDYTHVTLYSKTEKYRAAVASAVIFLENYPGSSYTEEVFYLMVKNSYYLTINSVESKKSQRIEDTYERMRNFEAVFNDSKYSKELKTYINRLGTNE